MTIPGAPAVRLDPASMAWNAVASYSSYEAAQAAVDRLSDDGFPVEHLDIVGSDLHLVERVTGRLTKGRAASAGMASGAWFGLMIGLVIGFFTTGANWLGVVLGGIAIGAIWGTLFGYAGHAATRGQRDFSSTKTLVAMKYDVIARDGKAEAAKEGLRNAGLLPAS